MPKYWLVFFLVLVCRLSAANGIIQTSGEFYSERHASALIIKSMGKTVSLEFYVEDNQGRRASVDADYEADSGWLGFMEGLDTVWLYAGGKTILSCKAEMAKGEMHFTFSKRQWDVCTERALLPQILRDYFDSKLGVATPK